MTLEETLQHLKALSSLTRFRIMNLLYENPGNGISPHKLVDILEVSKSNISRHAKILYKANLILEIKDGKYAYYFLNRNLKPKGILAILKEFKQHPTLKKDLKKLAKQGGSWLVRRTTLARSARSL